MNKLFKLIKKRSIFLLETSLSEALLANMIFGFDLAEKYNKTNQLISVAKFICSMYGSDLKHAKQVAVMAEGMFNQLKGVLGLKDSELLYLVLAAYLHNIGMFINNRSNHKHTEYIINALSFFRLSSQEIKCIACIARYHRKAHPQKTHYFYGGLAFERAAPCPEIGLDPADRQRLRQRPQAKGEEAEIQPGQGGALTLVVYSNDNFALEKVFFKDRKQLFEEISGSQLGLVVKKQTV